MPESSALNPAHWYRSTSARNLLHPASSYAAALHLETLNENSQPVWSPYTPTTRSKLSRPPDSVLLLWMPNRPEGKGLWSRRGLCELSPLSLSGAFGLVSTLKPAIECSWYIAQGVGMLFIPECVGKGIFAQVYSAKVYSAFESWRGFHVTPQ
jgi:hypothetical protein